MCNICSSHTECGSGQLCVGGACQACTVTCAGTPAQCGATLQVALSGTAPAVFVCPGAYQGGFSISRPVVVYGAGSDDNPATSTILDGNNVNRVVRVDAATGGVLLQDLRITQGLAKSGGGVYHTNGAFLQMTRCTVDQNVAYVSSFPANQESAKGGGVAFAGTQAALLDCQIIRNSAESGPLSGGGLGGGICATAGTVYLGGTTIVANNVAKNGAGVSVEQNSSLTVEANCRITGNDGIVGGGILNVNSTVALSGPDPSPIVVNNCHENCRGNVPKCQSGGTCPPGGG